MAVIDNRKQRKISFGVSIAVGALLHSSLTVAAGPYEIVRGRDLLLCRVVAANLNALSAEGPMVCERKVAPNAKDLSLPAWKPLQGDAVLLTALALERAV